MEWNACTNEPNIVLRWLECHPGSAAWAAALGTVMAVFIAASISQWQANRARRDLAEGISRYAAPAYFRFKIAMENLWSDVVREGFFTTTPRRDNLAIINELKIDIPEEFYEAAKMSAMADADAVRPFSDLFRDAAVYNGFLEAFERNGGFIDPELKIEFERNMRLTLAATRKSTNRAWHFFAGTVDPIPEVTKNLGIPDD